MRETSDMSVAYVAYFGIALIIGAVLVFTGVWWIYSVFAGHIETATQQPAQLPPQPRLQISPESDNRAYLEEEKKVLTTYGWIDRDKGVAKIPIDRAMDLLLSRGAK